MRNVLIALMCFQISSMFAGEAQTRKENIDKNRYKVSSTIEGYNVPESHVFCEKGDEVLTGGCNVFVGSLSVTRPVYVSDHYDKEGWYCQVYDRAKRKLSYIVTYATCKKTNNN